MSKITFGKYSGFELEEVPSDYLEWLISKYESDLYNYKAERDRRMHGCLNMAMKIASIGYRELSKKLHPDTGGTDDEMKTLNRAMEFIRKVSQEFE